MKFSTLRKALILLALVIAVAIPAAAFSGTGTSADPYVISSAEELKKMNNSSAYFKLGDNIKINDVSELFDKDLIPEVNGAEAWTPIENFTGTLDGANFYITGLYVTEENANGGLFATLNGATIQNVNLEFALVESDEYAGILAAKAEGETSISGCIATGSVIGMTTKPMNTAGGLVGFVGKDATVSTCASYATVTGATSYSANVGGLVGLNYGTITKCGYLGNVYGTATYYDATIGGIAGYNAGNIDNCRNAGDIGGESTAHVNDCYVGGIAGLNKGNIESCENDDNSTISVQNFTNGDSICAAGGIVGMTVDGDVDACTNNGAITGLYSYCGGIAGIAISDSGEHSIANCDNTDTGDITSEYGVAGGIVGRAAAAGEGYVSIKLHISNCYNSGDHDGIASDPMTGEKEQVESATVNVTVGAAANDNKCSALALYKFVADTVQYGEAATANTENVSGDIVRLGKSFIKSFDTDKSDYKIVRYTNTSDRAFMPAPVYVELVVVADASKVEILSVDASGLALNGNTLSGDVIVKVYKPNTSTDVDAVIGFSIGNKYVTTKFADVEKSDRVATVTVNVNATVDVTGTVIVNALVVNDQQSMEPLCKNEKVTK